MQAVVGALRSDISTSARLVVPRRPLHLSSAVLAKLAARTRFALCLLPQTRVGLLRDPHPDILGCFFFVFRFFLAGTSKKERMVAVLKKFQSGNAYNLIECDLVSFDDGRGRGVVAKKAVPKNTIIGFYPGFRDKKTEYPAEPIEYDFVTWANDHNSNKSLSEMEEHFSWLGVSDYSMETVIVTKNKDDKFVYRFSYDDPMKFTPQTWINDDMKIFQELYAYLWALHEKRAKFPSYSPELNQKRDDLVANLTQAFLQMKEGALSEFSINGETLLRVEKDGNPVPAGTDDSTLRFKQWTVVERMTQFGADDVQQAFEKLFEEEIMNPVAVLQRLCLKQKLPSECPFFTPFINSADTKSEQNVEFLMPPLWVEQFKAKAVKFPKDQGGLVTTWNFDEREPWMKDDVDSSIFHRVAFVTTKDIKVGDELLAFYTRDHDASRNA
jgi:hypothetical protein